ncbi:Aspartyl/glutamyl-tRNA (Asn/Gln) amidotransferase subunit B [Gossypium arboreum]|uniref:Aspartyl/glutamyl-tRNA (Asn/Gln) amidotransferase subunit B n=1 Tax=Gossypium arboreum TaxID=29729 RepID=A0A0B0N9S9_GOSAR|nr:Aspartyl/glutamyl-tRNA (Asn/Gln) amidotransferase subunit B [Gossypium arboreum]
MHINIVAPGLPHLVSPLPATEIIETLLPAKQERREEVLLKIVPPLDQAYVRWLARDIERIHSFSPRNPRAVKPPEHYIEYMQLNGWLDVDLDDPDLAHLFK